MEKYSCRCFRRGEFRILRRRLRSRLRNRARDVMRYVLDVHLVRTAGNGGGGGGAAIRTNRFRKWRPKNGKDSAWRCLDVAFGFAHSIKKRDSSFSFGAGSILSRNGVIWWFNGRAFHDNATSSRFLVI